MKVKSEKCMFLIIIKQNIESYIEFDLHLSCIELQTFKTVTQITYDLAACAVLYFGSASPFVCAGWVSMADRDPPGSVMHSELVRFGLCYSVVNL